MERLPLGDTHYFSFYFWDCTLGLANAIAHVLMGVAQ